MMHFATFLVERVRPAMKKVLFSWRGLTLKTVIPRGLGHNSSIGDGLKIDFPVKLRPFLSWSPKTHMLKDGKVVVCPLYRPEKLSISICKTAFSLC